jgi:predicted phosphodiesterase
MGKKHAVGHQKPKNKVNKRSKPWRPSTNPHLCTKETTMRLLAIAPSPVDEWDNPPGQADAVLDLAQEPITALHHTLAKTSRALRFGADLLVAPPSRGWANARSGRSWMAQLTTQAKARGYAVHTLAHGGAGLDAWRGLRQDHGWMHRDLGKWKRLLFLGDVHGRLEEARALVEPFASDRHTFLVFLGDIPSKGPQAAECVRWVGRTFQSPDRGLAIKGNHDLHLEDWALGWEVSKKDFTEHWPGAGKAITAKATRTMLAGMYDAAVLDWNGLTIHATHGGLAQPPQKGRTWSAADAIFGTGEPTTDIDAVWDSNTAGHPTHIQIHGHRNTPLHPVRAAERSWNLEGVESFGEVRALVLDAAPGGGVMAMGRCAFGGTPTWETAPIARL